jgi:16S rRNA (guanine(966)-N(2))-methyltransferase RsmD
MELRVISGKLKKMKLKVPKGTKPLSGIVKAALFSSIKENIPDSNILDLYAGSGALGIEALSMGARKVDFVEIDKSASDVIRENLLKTQLDQQAEVFNIPAEIFLRYNKKIDQIYNIILIFQPYDITSEDIIKKSIHLLKNNGIIVFERESKRDVQKINSLEIIKTKDFGKTGITIYRKM